MTNTVNLVAELLANHANVCVLTGAGVSAESGVATFRDPDGLWSKFSPQELASMDGFLANPERVRDWYAYRRSVVASVKPNAGHVALAEMERRNTSKFTLVTQNVDRLHQRAGSVNVLEIHGNLIENRCNSCQTLRTDEEQTCDVCGGIMRPNVVWFGENLPEDVFEAAQVAARECDVMLVVGTSAEVHPAARLPLTARDYGATIVEVNPQETAISSMVHYSLRGTSATILPQLLGGIE